MDVEWTVELKESVLDDLRWFGKKEGRLLMSLIDERLQADPLSETKNLKTLRPNPVAQRELSISGKYRVLFNVDIDEKRVTVILVGLKKGNTLLVRGEEFTRHHESHSP